MQKQAAQISATAASNEAREPAIDDQANDDLEMANQDDEELLDLDDTQEDLIPQTTTEEKKQPVRNLEIIVDTFVIKYSSPGDIKQSGKLSVPVILPQRRPKSRSRGFIRAYAPVLQSKGIDEAMFLDFLQTFDQALEASPWINALKFAGIAENFMNPGFGILLTISIQITIKTAEEVQGRVR